MRYRYRAVYGDGQLIAITFASGEAIFNVYFTDYFFGARYWNDVRDGANIDALTADDYPPQVRDAHRALTFAPVMESPELPRIQNNATATEVRGWMREQRKNLARRC